MSHACRLDFRGGWVSGRDWNTLFEKDNISWPAYDSDGDPNAFTDKELGQIAAIWRAVAEDFAPFNVDVTTIDQIIAETANSNYMRVAIGGSGEQVLNITKAGGIAYVGVFGSEDLQNQPAFVFPDNLCIIECSGGVKYVWEATSHEVSLGGTQACLERCIYMGKIRVQKTRYHIIYYKHIVRTYHSSSVGCCLGRVGMRPVCGCLIDPLHSLVLAAPTCSFAGR
jgi:hypothetical protein